jgi:Uma2 family endonuclease
MEVSDSTLRKDRVSKARLYARAGIPEYWVIDVKNRRLLVFREPSGGAYQVSFELAETESVAPLEKPTYSIAAASLVR